MCVRVRVCECQCQCEIPEESVHVEKNHLTPFHIVSLLLCCFQKRDRDKTATVDKQVLLSLIKFYNNVWRLSFLEMMTFFSYNTLFSYIHVMY